MFRTPKCKQKPETGSPQPAAALLQPGAALPGAALPGAALL